MAATAGSGPMMVPADTPAPPGWCVEPVLDLAGRDAAVAYDPRRHTVIWFMQPPAEALTGRMAADGWQRISGDTRGELWALDRIQRDRALLTRPVGGLEPPSVA